MGSSIAVPSLRVPRYVLVLTASQPFLYAKQEDTVDITNIDYLNLSLSKLLQPFIIQHDYTILALPYIQPPPMTSLMFQ